ncbi:MAG: type II toxin-antitoxin system HicA family toxin [Anaerolineae bacterium]|nr:type II toxin-antitoxin system HicA family toxin [Anaerolineae bacterium]
MRYSELVKKLRRLGCQFHRQGKGSHEYWYNPATDLYTSVPHHRNREIPNGTLHKILKELGLSLKDLQK